MREHIVETFERQKRIAKKIARKKKGYKKRKRTILTEGSISLDLGKGGGKRKNKSIKSPTRSLKLDQENSYPESPSLSERSDIQLDVIDESPNVEHDKKINNHINTINLFNNDANPTNQDLNSPEFRKSG